MPSLTGRGSGLKKLERVFGGRCTGLEVVEEGGWEKVAITLDTGWVLCRLYLFWKNRCSLGCIPPPIMTIPLYY